MISIIPEIKKIINEFNNKSAEEILRFVIKKLQNKIALASSLGAEDQVLTDKVLKNNPYFRIFVL